MYVVGLALSDCGWGSQATVTIRNIQISLGSSKRLQNRTRSMAKSFRLRIFLVRVAVLIFLHGEQEDNKYYNRILQGVTASSIQIKQLDQQILQPIDQETNVLSIDASYEDTSNVDCIKE